MLPIRYYYGSMIVTVIVACLLLIAYAPAVAQTSPPIPIPQPHLGPPANPQPFVVDNHQIFNDLIVPLLPAQSRSADIANEGKPQEPPGRGIWQTDTGLGSGLTLYTQANVCNDFNKDSGWSSHTALANNIWSDHYAGWGVYAFDDKRFYYADNVTFALERTTGPGNKFDEQYSIKISSGQPYAAGLGSPIIKVPPGAAVTVNVKYMIFDHDTHGQDYDWASLGLKPNAEDMSDSSATFVNGYVRGQWAELIYSIIAGQSGKIMILIQAQSPAALNSNIYFDDIQIAVNGEYLDKCLYAQEDVSK